MVVIVVVNCHVDVAHTRIIQAIVHFHFSHVFILHIFFMIFPFFIFVVFFFLFLL